MGPGAHVRVNARREIVSISTLVSGDRMATVQPGATWQVPPMNPLLPGKVTHGETDATTFTNFKPRLKRPLGEQGARVLA